ncbi:MAG TPA: serine/threonine-protein kinase, partial [Kofleriaceae bacterium]|nr:serine/threonine-protein kinase [Kofleriaceae bacterium]
MSGVSGKYRLDQRLGGGGMAEVFLASAIGAEGFSRKVAIKRVLPGFSDNEAFAKMFVDEAQLSSQLVHPNIVSVLDFDRDAEQRLFLVMELVEGRDLAALVDTGLLPIPVVIYVLGEVLRGLGYAHDLPVGAHVRGLVHRDVSPHNVLLSWEGAVKVSDFGIAKARAASEATASVFIKGKPAYMSPEQANGQALDGRSDLFAVGIMLWEMLVGRRLFVGTDTRSTLAAVLFAQIPRPRSLRGDVPKDLERVTMKLLERDLPARYATAEHAIADLLECADAPKAGRELLTATLAERFPDLAPVRHSQRRVRSLPPGARAPGTPPRGQATLPDGSPAAAAMPVAVAVDAATLPSLGAVRNAPTATLERPDRAPPPGAAYPAPSLPPGAAYPASALPLDGPRRSGRLLLAGAVLVVAAIASFAVVSAMTGRDASRGAGAGSQLVAGAPDPA